MHRRERVLEDHRHVLAAPQPHLLVADREQVGAVEEDPAADLARGAAVQAEDRRARDRLARAGLAHDAERLAPLEREAEPVGRLDHAVGGREVHPQVVDREEGVCESWMSATSPSSSSRTRGSMTAYSRSTMMLATMTNVGQQQHQADQGRQVVVAVGRDRQLAHARGS